MTTKSRDLNPVDKKVWSIIQQRVRSRRVSPALGRLAALARKEQNVIDIAIDE